MNSAIVNRQQEKVEQLADPSTSNKPLFYIQPGGSIPFTLVYATGFYSIPLQEQTVYEISRIRVVVYFFMDEAGAGFAFPRWEQFAINLYITAYLSDANGNVQNRLFNNLEVNITDGITESGISFKEPFIFKTSASNGIYLRLITDGSRSIFTQLTNIVLPPPAGLIGVTVYGQVILEGRSYSYVKELEDAKINEQAKIASGIETDNVVEIDI